MSERSHPSASHQIRVPLLMALLGAVLGGGLSWAIAPWAREAERQREQIVADYEARPKTPLDPPTIIIEEKISGKGDLLVINKPGPGVPPEVVDEPTKPATLLPVLGAAIGFLWSYIKLNWRR